jgi:hypothetical protein
MTKFDELVDIITRNKNKGKAKQSEAAATEREDQNQELEVAGSESSKNPLITFGDSQTDPDLLEQLYTKSKYKPNDGFGADRWDS